jgi:hypothetical protein
MKPEQQKQAQSLYFQTDLSKTEIAKMIGVSRRSLHYWVHDNNWEQTRKCAQAMPVQITENNYFILAKLQESILSADRAAKPVTIQEANALYKLTLTINKLKSRSTLNENLEMTAGMMDYIGGKDPILAEMITPLVNDYIGSQAKTRSTQPMPGKFNSEGYIPVKEESPAEALLDLEDIKAWAAEKATASEESVSNAPITTKEGTRSSSLNANEMDKKITAKTEKMPDVATSFITPNNLPKGKANNRAARRKMARMAAAQQA